MSQISIIIPVYNAEKYIDRCLNSIQNQTFQDYELILVNDGSTDHSRDICVGYEQNDLRIHVLDKENGGAASARNMGLDWLYTHSESEWICFIDSDDFVHARYLELLYDAVVKSRQEISMCSYVTTQEDSVSCDITDMEIRLMDTETLWCQRQINCTIPWAKLFKRNMWKGIRFPEGIIHEDEFTLYKVLFKCRQIAFMNLPLYGYYQTSQSVMRGAWTPRHMTEPEGILSQLEFFQKNNYRTATSYTADIYIRSIYRNLVSARECGKKYEKYVCILRKQLKIALKNYKHFTELNMNNSTWLYYEAYPIASIPYRICQRCIHCLKR